MRIYDIFNAKIVNDMPLKVWQNLSLGENMLYFKGFSYVFGLFKYLMCVNHFTKPSVNLVTWNSTCLTLKNNIC